MFFMKQWQINRTCWKINKKEVFVRNIAFHVTDDDLYSFFEQVGTVKEVKLLHGKAYVEFEDEEVASKAIELDGQDLEGRALRVDFSRG